MATTNSLYAWLMDRGHWIASGQDRVCSHVFLDGGKACVPPDETQVFVQTYCSALRNGTVQYAVEQRTPVFKLFMDIDLQSRAVLDADMIDRICSIVYDCSRKFFFPTTASMVVAAAPPRRLSSGSTKTGMHCHWPDILVTSSKAMSFRAFCVAECNKALGECFVNTWENIIDSAVYKSSGLRMLGSSKRDVPGTYLPFILFEHGGNVTRLECDAVLANLCHWVTLCSIRAPHERTHLPKVEQDSTDETFESTVLQNDHGGSIKRVRIQEVRPVIEDFMDLINKQFYKDLRITSVYEAKSSGVSKKKKLILGTNCKNCMNKDNGTHRSNHVYFLIEETGVYQKCFCRCDTLKGRKYKMCREYQGRVGNLSPAMVQFIHAKPKMRCLIQETGIESLAKTILSAYR